MALKEFSGQEEQSSREILFQDKHTEIVATVVQGGQVSSEIAEIGSIIM